MKRMFISIVVGLALLLGLMPAAVTFAADTGSTAASFSVGGVAPQVSALQVYSDAGCTLMAAALTPQVVYYIKATISDANTLNDIKQVKIKVFYDVGATHPDESTITVGNVQTAGIFTWTKVGSVWAVDAGAGVSWAIVSGSSVVPTLTASSGDWIFAIKLGKVATESIAPNVWDLHARATDSGNLTSGYNLWNKAVLWYGAMQVNTANVNFGAVALGSGFGANTNKVTDISVTFISNGDYNEEKSASATWTGTSHTATLDPTGNCVNAGEFALKGWISDIYGSAQLLDATGVHVGVGTQTDETGDTHPAQTCWLKIASVFPVDVYSGTITFLICNH